MCQGNIGHLEVCSAGTCIYRDILESCSLKMCLRIKESSWEMEQYMGLGLEYVKIQKPTLIQLV